MPARMVRLRTTSKEIRAGFDRIRAEFDVPTTFPPAVERAAHEAARRAAKATRIDARDLSFVTIDPPGSRDLDQAYFAERVGSTIRIRYAIADVAHFVRVGDAIDDEARVRGVTRYLPDRRSPLHPDVLGEGAASLLPRADRPALLWTIDLDGSGAAGPWRLERAVVRSRRALTYAAVSRAIRRGRGSESLRLLRDIGRLRQEQERARGGFSISVPSQEVRRSRGGYALSYDERLDTEDWNAQVSLLTGMCAARAMQAIGTGILRTLPPPEPQTVERLKLTARALGVEWPQGASYGDVVRGLSGSEPTHAAFVNQAVELLRGAGYEVIDASTRDAVHHAVGAPYAHVTAPLRRLADRFANEIVLAAAAGDDPPAWAVDALPTLPGLMGEAMRRAAAIERAVVDLVESLVLRNRIGEVFAGVVVDVERQAVVQLSRPAVIASLDSQDVGLGDEVSVRLTSVVPEERRVELELA